MGQTNQYIEKLKEAIDPARRAVVSHPFYSRLGSMDAVVTFMEHHVFAIWDFMSLLKTLQGRLTCVQVPWLPSGPTASRRLINDIVLDEESDEFGTGFISHFELYLDGMRQAGAQTAAIESFIELLRAGQPVVSSLKEAGMPAAAAEFIGAT